MTHEEREAALDELTAITNSLLEWSERHGCTATIHTYNLPHRRWATASTGPEVLIDTDERNDWYDVSGGRRQRSARLRDDPEIVALEVE